MRVHATEGEGQHVETRQVHVVTVVGGDEERVLVAEQRQQAPQPGAHGAPVDVPVTQLDGGTQALALGQWELGEAVGDRVEEGQHRGVRHVGVTAPAMSGQHTHRPPCSGPAGMFDEVGSARALGATDGDARRPAAKGAVERGVDGRAAARWTDVVGCHCHRHLGGAGQSASTWRTGASAPTT